MTTKGVAGTYTLLERVGVGFVARTIADEPALLLPLTDATLLPGRSTRGVRLAFYPSITFTWHGDTFSAPAAVLECHAPDLAHTFDVLGRGIARNLPQPSPTAEHVVEAFAEWQDLLRTRRVMSESEQVGLWGELWMLRNLDDLDLGLAAWRGPNRSAVDFVGGGIGVECKTSFRRHIHHFSLSQLDRPLGDTDVYIVSFWVEQDETAGITVNDHIDFLKARVSNPDELYRKLARAGYYPDDAPEYTLKLRLLEEPVWVDCRRVPRVRTADPGVERITFEATLDTTERIAPQLAIHLAHRLIGATS